MNWGPFFIVAFLIGLVHLLIGLYQQKFPPKKINDFYGYRTRRSIQSPERWDFAQQFSAKELIKWRGLLVLISFADFVINLDPLVGLLIAMALYACCLFLIITRTEAGLRKRFEPKIKS